MAHDSSPYHHPAAKAQAADTFATAQTQAEKVHAAAVLAAEISLYVASFYLKFVATCLGTTMLTDEG